MAIKATVEQEHAHSGRPFPKLMISDIDGCVVLMRHADSGMVMFGSGLNRIGYHSDGWNMKMFRDFNGAVNLTNE